MDDYISINKIAELKGLKSTRAIRLAINQGKYIASVKIMMCFDHSLPFFCIKSNMSYVVKPSFDFFNKSISVTYNNITNYSVLNDYIGNFQAYVGYTYYIPPIPIKN